MSDEQSNEAMNAILRRGLGMTIPSDVTSDDMNAWIRSHTGWGATPSDEHIANEAEHAVNYGSADQGLDGGGGPGISHRPSMSDKLHAEVADRRRNIDREAYSNMQSRRASER